MWPARFQNVWSHGENMNFLSVSFLPPVCGGIQPRSGRCQKREMNRAVLLPWHYLSPPPSLNLTIPTPTLNGDPKFLKHAPLSFYDTLCVYIYVSIWIRAQIRSSTNKIEGGWLGTGREGWGTESGKKGGRQRTREGERDRVWREGGRDSERERAKARVQRTCTACILWKGRER